MNKTGFDSEIFQQSIDLIGNTYNKIDIENESDPEYLKKLIIDVYDAISDAKYYCEQKHKL